MKTITSTEQNIRSLPAAIEIEEAVTGALLIEPDRLRDIDGIVSESDFFDRKTRLVFGTIAGMFARREKIDLLTVCETLRKEKRIEDAGGAYGLAMMAQRVVSAAHIEYHSRVVRDKSIARSIIERFDSVIQKAYDGTEDISDVIEHAEAAITDLNRESAACSSISMREAVNLAINDAARLQAERQAGRLTAIPTGLSELDRAANGGWKSPELIVIGAKPSMGKTQLSLLFARTAANAGKHVLFISAEMTAIQLINRYLTEDGVNFYSLKNGQMSPAEWAEIDSKSASLRTLPVYIADSYNIRNVQHIKTEARKKKLAGKLDLLIIDYLQLLKTPVAFRDKRLEIGYITFELKALAKELDVPVILLSQLSRSSKNETGKEPLLEDLKEAGEIENDSDMVIFIHRPTYYDADAKDKYGLSWKNRGKLIIGKNREGERGNTVLFSHDEKFKRIFDYNGLAHGAAKRPDSYRDYTEPVRADERGDIPF